MHKTTPTRKVAFPTMTGSRAAGGVRQRSMGCPLTSEKMWNSPEDRLWMSSMLELGILLTNGRPFIGEDRRGLASPLSTLQENLGKIYSHQSRTPCGHVIRSWQWKRRECHDGREATGSKLHGHPRAEILSEQIQF